MTAVRTEPYGVEESIRTRMDAHRPKPSHVCMICGALVSSEDGWPGRHVAWHESLQPTSQSGDE